MATKIDKIYLAQMTNGAHFQFLTYAYERIDVLCPTLKTRFPDEVEALKTCLENEDKLLVVSQKSALTDKIAHYDQLRDTYYTSFKSLVKSYLKMPEGEDLEAAKTLWQLTVDYAIDPKMQLDRQTGMMANILNDLEQKYSAQVEKIGAKPLVDKMKEANEQVKSLMAERDQEYSHRVIGGTKAARKATDEAYEKLVEKINAVVLLEDEAPYLDYIKEMNARIARYKHEAPGAHVEEEADDKPVVPDDTENPGESGETGGGTETPEEPEGGDEEEDDGPQMH